MPAKDKYHYAVRNALVKDGWMITDDPFRLVWGERDFYVDLGAERVFAAEKAGRRIAVEVKSFLGAGQMNDLEGARSVRALSDHSGRAGARSRVVPCDS